MKRNKSFLYPHLADAYCIDLLQRTDHRGEHATSEKSLVALAPPLLLGWCELDGPIVVDGFPCVETREWHSNHVISLRSELHCFRV